MIVFSMDYKPEHLAAFYFMYPALGPVLAAKLTMLIWEDFELGPAQRSIMDIALRNPDEARRWCDKVSSESGADGTNMLNPVVAAWIEDLAAAAYLAAQQRHVAWMRPASTAWGSDLVGAALRCQHSIADQISNGTIPSRVARPSSFQYVSRDALMLWHSGCLDAAGLMAHIGDFVYSSLVFRQSPCQAMTLRDVLPLYSVREIEPGRLSLTIRAQDFLVANLISAWATQRLRAQDPTAQEFFLPLTAGFIGNCLHMLIGNIALQYLWLFSHLIFPTLLLTFSYQNFIRPSTDGLIGNDSHRLVGNGRWFGSKGSNWKGKGKGGQNDYNDQAQSGAPFGTSGMSNLFQPFWGSSPYGPPPPGTGYGALLPPPGPPPEVPTSMAPPAPGGWLAQQLATVQGRLKQFEDREKEEQQQKQVADTCRDQINALFGLPPAAAAAASSSSSPSSSLPPPPNPQAQAAAAPTASSQAGSFLDTLKRLLRPQGKEEQLPPEVAAPPAELSPRADSSTSRRESRGQQKRAQVPLRSRSRRRRRRRSPSSSSSSPSRSRSRRRRGAGSSAKPAGSAALPAAHLPALAPPTPAAATAGAADPAAPHLAAVMEAMKQLMNLGGPATGAAATKTVAKAVAKPAPGAAAAARRPPPPALENAGAEQPILPLRDGAEGVFRRPTQPTPMDAGDAREAIATAFGATGRPDVPADLEQYFRKVARAAGQDRCSIIAESAGVNTDARCYEMVRDVYELLLTGEVRLK